MRVSRAFPGPPAIVLPALLAIVVMATVSPVLAKKEKGKSTAATTAAPAETVLVRVGNEKITTATVRARLDELPEQVRGNFTSP